MKMILNIKVIIFFLLTIIFFILGFYAFKKAGFQRAQVIFNDNQTVPMAKSLTDEIAQNDAVTENAPTGTIIEQNELVVIEKTPSTVTEKSTELVGGLASEPRKEDSRLSLENSPKTVIKLFTSGFQVAEGRKIDTIVIHSSYDALGDDPYSISGIIQEYKDYGVSAHYLIGRDGTVYQLVREKDIAYHAGVSSVPDGRTGVNVFSVGIELVNTKTDKFTASQYNVLNDLISELKSRYNIKYVLGHNQIAPDRKDDPWNFDWSKLK